MIKFLRHNILPLFMGACLGVLLPACINEGEDTLDVAERNDGFNISIAISAGDAPTARAGLPDKPGIGAENYINTGDLQIYAFSTDGTQLLAQVYPNANAADDGLQKPDVIPMGNGVYLLKAELPYNTFSKLENQQFKLVAVANHKVTNKVTGLSSLQNEVYSFTTNWELDNGIPMYGFRNVSLKGYSFKENNEWNPYQLDDVDMLRAMAKIEVIDAIDDKEITSVSISSYNTTGYVAPLAETQTEDGTVDVEKANIPDPPVTESTTPLDFSQNGDTFVAYLPEYALDATNRKDIITVTIKNEDNTEKQYSLSLAPYTIDIPDLNPTEYYWQALLRNHIYRYTITNVNGPEEVNGLTIDYMVCPMDNKTSGDIEFD